MQIAAAHAGAEQQETAVAQRHDCGHRYADKSLPGGQPRSRLEPKLLGAAQHLRNANCPATEAMADLLGIGAEAVKTQQHYQRREPWIWPLRFVLLRTHFAIPSERLMRGEAGREERFDLSLLRTDRRHWCRHGHRWM